MPTLCRRPLPGLFFAMLLLLVPALSVGAAGPVSAPGALDTSVGNSGIVATGLSGTEVSRGLALQRDGKIVVVGSAGAKITLVRLLGDALLFTPRARQ